MAGEADAHVNALRHALAAVRTVRWAYLFGSAARGGAFRDLDVAVMLDAEARGAVALGGVAAELERAAGNTRVDVVDLASAAPALAGKVAREGKVLVDRAPAERRDWEMDANRRALDIEPWLARADDLRRRARAARAERT